MHPGDTRPARVVAAPGLLAYALTSTFASVDWMMSLDPHWFSTMYGLLLIVGQGLSAFAFVIAMLALLSAHRAGRQLPDLAPLPRLGKLMLAFVMLWAYFSFSQFLIIWGGNLPEEVGWYVERFHGPWGYVALLIAFGHFALPFTLLLSRNLKKRGIAAGKVAIGILVMRLVDLIWLIEPTTSTRVSPSTGWIWRCRSGWSACGCSCSCAS